MTDPQAPTTEEVRSDYALTQIRNYDEYMTGRSLASEQARVAEAFDRWLAQTVAAEIERAADEMEGEILRDGGLSVRGVFRVKSHNWLRARAVTIREKGLTA